MKNVYIYTQRKSPYSITIILQCKLYYIVNLLEVHVQREVGNKLYKNIDHTKEGVV